MNGLVFPYTVIVSDGRTMRTLQARAFGSDRTELEAIIQRAIDPQLGAPVLAATPTPAKNSPTGLPPTMTQGEMARAQGYAGECCTKCGGWRMKQAGHCMVCDDCGETTGCS